MFHRIRKHTISFQHAFSGISAAFRTQPNFRIHVLAALCVIAAGWYFRLNPVEWVVVTFTILWMLLSEMINTAIESMVDLISLEYSVQAKTAKDVAAGAVLMGAVGSLVIAALIFVPKIIAVLTV